MKIGGSNCPKVSFWMGLKIVFWYQFYQIMKWRTHDILVGYVKGIIYIGARRKSQSPKNFFHTRLRTLGYYDEQ